MSELVDGRSGPYGVDPTDVSPPADPGRQTFYSSSGAGDNVEGVFNDVVEDLATDKADIG